LLNSREGGQGKLEKGWDGTGITSNTSVLQLHFPSALSLCSFS